MTQARLIKIAINSVVKVVVPGLQCWGSAQCYEHLIQNSPAVKKGAAPKRP